MRDRKSMSGLLTILKREKEKVAQSERRVEELRELLREALDGWAAGAPASGPSDETYQRIAAIRKESGL